MQEEFKKAASLIAQAKRLLIVVKEHASVDELAALLALAEILRRNNQQVTALSQNPLPKAISFLPGINQLTTKIGDTNELVISVATKQTNVENLRHVMNDDRLEIIITGKDHPLSSKDVTFKKSAEKFDCIVVIGASDLEDCGTVFQENPKLFTQCPLINISQQVDNSYFGKINLVDLQAASVCEIVFQFIQTQFPNHLDKTIATTILTGIISETESFLANNTTTSALKTAAELQTIGADQSNIIEHLYKEKTPEDVKTLGQILNNLELAEVHQFAWSTLSKNDFSQTETTPKDIDHWSDQLLRHINRSDFFVLFVEYPDHLLLQIRSKNRNIDFSGLRIDDSIITQKNKNGLDLIITQQKFDNAKTTWIQNFATFQENRLKIVPTEVKTIVQTVATHNNLSDIGSMIFGETSAPIKTEKNRPIPFEIPDTASDK